jgi:hypothetical protein
MHMKNKIVLLITSVALVAVLKFPHSPSCEVIELLAGTQPSADTLQIHDWFAAGETGFILSSTHTNAIAAAIADGATATVIHGSSSALTAIYGKK